MKEHELAQLREADRLEDQADALAATGSFLQASQAMQAANRARRSVLGEIVDVNELRAMARAAIRDRTMTQSTDFLAELAALAEKAEAYTIRPSRARDERTARLGEFVLVNLPAILALGRELEECDAREAGLIDDLSDAALREENLGRERDALRSAVERIAHFPNRVKTPAQDARDMQSIARQALEGGNQ